MIHLETSRFNIKIVARVLLLFFRSFPRPSWKLPRIHIEENGLSEGGLGRQEWPVSSDQFLAKKSGRILVVNTVLIMLAGYLQPACDTSFFRSFPGPSWKLPRIHIEENGLSERALGRHEWPVSSGQFLAKKGGRILIVNTVLIMLAGFVLFLINLA